MSNRRYGKKYPAFPLYFAAEWKFYCVEKEETAKCAPMEPDGKTENILPILIGMVEMHTGLVYIMDGQNKTGGIVRPDPEYIYSLL